MSVQRRGAAFAVFAAVVLAFSSAADAGWGWFANSAGGYGSAGYGSVGYGSLGYSSAGYGSAGYGSGGWGARRSWGGSWGGYGSAGYTRVAYGSAGYGSAGYASAGYASAGYGSGGWGSHGGRVGLFRRHHARAVHGSRGGWGSYGGGHYVSYGSVGYASGGSHGYGSAGSHVSYSHGSYGSVGSSVSYAAPVCESSTSVVTESYSVPMEAGVVQESAACCGGETLSGTVMEGTVVEGVPVEQAAPATEMKVDEGAASEKADEPTPTTDDDEASLDADATMISVMVPEDADVYVNGYRTQSGGMRRRFVSSGLQAGRKYAFEVRVVAQRDGREVSDSQVLQVMAGERNELAFNLPTTTEVESTLTLHVPENAEVTLAGSPTRIGGATRVFRTTRLSANETWDNYTVQVSWEDHGQTLTRSKSITLVGGEARELSFGSEDTAVAMNK
jgi:uncharacterized protein (TIGR03000 family)